MGENSKVGSYLGIFIFVIIGYFVSTILRNFLLDIAPSTPILGIFTPSRLSNIVYAIAWLIVCYLCYVGSTRFIDEGEHIGILSLFFVITLLVVSLGMIIAVIIQQLIESGSISVNFDTLLDSYFLSMIISISPALAATLGVSNKSHVHN